MIHVDIDLAVSKTPREMDTKESFNHTHEGNCEKTGEDLLELRFNRVAGGEEDKIISVKAKSKQNEDWSVRWVVRIFNEGST